MRPGPPSPAHEQSCRHADCTSTEIASGQALGTNTLRVTSQGSSQIRLDWDPLDASTELASSRLYRVWRGVLPDAPLELLVETTAQHYTDNDAGRSFVA